MSHLRRKTYLIQEIQDERYEILFGDGIFGKKLEDGTVVTRSYITTSGKEGNGPSIFAFAAVSLGQRDK